MSYKNRRARTEDSTEVRVKGVSRSGGEGSQGGSGVFGRAPELISPELVVFVCTDDSGAAHIGTAWFQMLADPRKARTVLASPRGIARISPEIVTALQETGGNLQTVHARTMTVELLASADLVVTMGRSFHRGSLGAATPDRREHWLIPNLDGVTELDRARSLRDVIRSRVAMLVFTEGWGRADISREAARVTRPRRTGDFFAVV
jgi:arsenate reductase (thioredoxin)